MVRGLAIWLYTEYSKVMSNRSVALKAIINWLTPVVALLLVFTATRPPVPNSPPAPPLMGALADSAALAFGALASASACVVVAAPLTPCQPRKPLG